jgi:hypothetical protein
MKTYDSLRGLFTSVALTLVIGLTLSDLARAEIKDTASQTRVIDKLVNAGLAEKELKPNAPINDQEFVRRIYLATAGRIPTGVEAETFLQSDDKDKRDKLIDELLESEGYVSHFYNYWADILRINRRLGRSGASNEYAYKHWVKESLRSNRPYDKMVFEMISARGDVWDNGATGYYQRDRGMPLDNMANTVRVFLGTRLECAQCHDHPFDEWSQQDFFHMASFTFGVRPDYVGGNRAMIRDTMNDERREVTKKLGEEISGIKGFYPYRRDSDIKRIYASDDKRSVARRFGIKTEKEFRAINKKVQDALSKYSSETRIVNRLVSDIYNPLRYATVGGVDRNSQLPHDYQYDDAKPNQEIEPRVMFGQKLDEDKLDDGYLEAYASWMTAKDNPRFTRVIANRLWKKAFGLGLVEPIDQLTAETVPTNPELLDFVEQCMKDMDYDMKSFLAMIYKSEAWQRRACTEEIAPGTPFYFPGPAMQRMSAEQIWDSLATLTIPDVDRYQPTLLNELRAIDRDRKIRDALESHSPKEFQEIVKNLSAEVRKSYKKMEVVRADYLKARQSDDNVLIRKLSGELRELTSAMRRRISEVAYKGADGRTDNALALMQIAGMTEMNADDKNGSQRSVRTQLVRVAIDTPEGLTKKERANWIRQQRSYSSSWGNLARSMMRASELPTPAPRGHFLREFGQSDRELIQNANQAASVPQALSLMNSSMADTLRHPYSVLGQALAKCETPSEEIETIYELMLTRKPSENETKRLLREYEANPKTAQNNIVWALLNTQQFIFIR